MNALPPITGVYDVCIGVRPSDVAEVVNHYQQFGFGEPSPEGSLTADEAEHLYGYHASLRAVRLPHQESDHGLLVSASSRVASYSPPSSIPPP